MKLPRRLPAREPASRPTRRRGWIAALATVLLVLTGTWVGAGPANAAAATLGLQKTASVATASPGDSFTYTLVAQCSSLTVGCVNAVLTDVFPADVVVNEATLPPSNAARTVAYDAGSRTLRITFTSDVGGGQVGMTAGSSQNFQIGVSIPADSQIADGATIANTAHLAADNADPVPATANVTAVVPPTVTPTATKTWSPDSAVAGSGAASTITLGAASSSSSSAQVSQLLVQDATPAVFDRFDVTGIGPVSFPAGANRVTVLACTQLASACGTADWAASAAQSGPNLTLPPGVAAADVTGLRFVFTNSAGTALPNDPTGGTVRIATVLRDTLRSTGAVYSPTNRDDVTNCAGPSAVESHLGTVTGTQTCATFSVQPAQATMTLTKSLFSDTNGNYAADGQAVIGQNSLVSALIKATNTSPFPVSTMTITDPSGTTPSEFDKIDVSNLRLVFPGGATSAALDIDCGGGDIRHQSYATPPGTVNVPVPCPSGKAAGVTATFTGTITPNAVATLGVQGRLNDNVNNNDLPTGTSPGVTDCADGTATSADTGIGAAAATGCGTVVVQPAFSQVTGVKSSQLPTILPGLPREFDFAFTNRGTVPATGLVITDPADPATSTRPFDVLELQSLALPANPAATAELYDPDAGAYVPYDAGDTALLARATGFRVTLPTLAAGATYRFSTQMLLRDGVDPGTRIQNCAAFGTDSQAGAPFCAPLITVLAQSSGASIQKSISPATSVRPEAGLPGTPIQVKLAAQNTGTLWLKRLVATDTDAAFFDAVEATGTVNVNFPPGADRVQVDTCTGACGPGDFTNGTPTASTSPGLPAGVNAAEVRGFRITFTVHDGSFTIRPGTNFPTGGACTGASICFTVTPRIDLRSAPGTPVPTTLSDTATGGYESTQQDGALAPIPGTSATHTLTDGTAQLSVAKSAGVGVAGPGDTVPFTITVRNTGTGPLTDPSIVDPLPNTLTFAPADPAKPYTISYTLTPGGPSPTTVRFTPTSDTDGNVSSLRWDFPGWDLLPGEIVTITFDTTLAPGVLANQSVTNTAGGTSTRPGMACATGSGTAVDDPAYGTGTYCTDDAAVTTRAGNAIQTAKWVAGDTELGWLNSLTGELLPTGDPSCPRLTVDGTQFTRYPCVARVVPGEGFDYYLKVTNAGTNPSTQVRIVDVFPAPGDTGVLLTNQQRGTEWAQPPTLLTPVTLAGTGALTADYTDQVPACASDLSSPPVACPAGDWDLGYQATATAFRSIIDFPTPLAPGASTALQFRMAAPPAPSDPSQNEIAWNSFAHTEFFDDNGTIVQLPPTEPIKTGVALVFGALRITKTVIGQPNAAQAGPYTLQYQCSTTWDADPTHAVTVASGTLELDAGQSQTIADVPARAICDVWESDAHGLISDAQDQAHAKQVTIPVSGTTETQAGITISNTVPTPVSTGPGGGTTPASGPTSPAANGLGPQPTAQNVAPDGNELASTGADLGGPIRLALYLLLIGALLIAVTRVRRRPGG